LMAIMIAIRLRERGYSPCVFRLDPHLARVHELVTVTSLQELLEGAACCVIGGGAFLVGEGFQQGFYAALLEDLTELETGLRQRRMPVIGVSLGGSGKLKAEAIPPPVRRVFANRRFLGTSVRLPTDVELLAGCSVKAVYYPDIVLTAATFLGSRPYPACERTDVLIQYHDSAKTRALFRPICRLAHRQGRSVRFVKTHLSAHRQAHPEVDAGSQFTLPYEDPIGLLAALASTRVLIAGKLHIGVAAVSLGKCFLSLGGMDKTLAFLSSIGRSEFWLPKRAILPALWILLSSRAARGYERRFEIPNLSKLHLEAEHHYEFLLERLLMCRERKNDWCDKEPVME
jgi:hypothetical protein